MLSSVYTYVYVYYFTYLYPSIKKKPMTSLVLLSFLKNFFFVVHI